MVRLWDESQGVRGYDVETRNWPSIERTIYDNAYALGSYGAIGCSRHAHVVLMLNGIARARGQFRIEATIAARGMAARIIAGEY